MRWSEWALSPRPVRAPSRPPSAPGSSPSLSSVEAPSIVGIALSVVLLARGLEDHSRPASVSLSDEVSLSAPELALCDAGTVEADRCECVYVLLLGCLGEEGAR